MASDTSDGDKDQLPARPNSLADDESPPFAGPLEMITTAQVARRYYLDHRSKVQIAAELGITRFKVARLLELAHTSGMVRITVVDADDQPLLGNREDNQG